MHYIVIILSTTVTVLSVGCSGCTFTVYYYSTESAAIVVLIAVNINLYFISVIYVLFLLLHIILLCVPV